MPTDEYERLRQRLEQQLRADIDLIQEAYRAKLRAFETVARTRGELGLGEPGPAMPALELPARLLGGPGAGQPAGWSASGEPSTGGAPGPAAPPASRRSGAFEVENAVEEALEKVGEVFDRNDLCRVLGFQPKRSTISRILRDLEIEGRIVMQKRGIGRTVNLYRKAAPPPEPAA
jgi:hypothetical protein